MRYSRLGNVKNPFQGKFKKVLCLCSMGLLRSPTVAWVLSNPPFNFNTRSAGVEDLALTIVDEVLLEWADEIVCMMPEHKAKLEELHKVTKPIHILYIEDNFEFKDPELVAIAESACKREFDIKDV